MATPDHLAVNPVAVSFELDDEIVVLSPTGEDLYVLNSTAALVWQGITNGFALSEIAEIISASTSGPSEDVIRDCDAIVSRWRHLGLVTSEDEQTAPVPPRRGTATARGWWSDEEPAPVESGAPSAIARNYRIVDFDFSLCTSNGAVERSAHDFLDHLRIPDATSVRRRMDLIRDDARWCLHTNGRLIDSCSSERSVVPMLHAHLMMAAYRTSACIVALHAAAVSMHGRCLVLAGISGSGKSTLTSALLARGFAYLCDDTALLTPPPVRLRGVPMKVGLKEGAWKVVEGFRPDIHDVPVHDRPDGKRLRYLQTGVMAAGSSEEADDTILVFPRYSAGAATSLVRIRRADALLQLTHAGYDTGGAADREVVGALVSWVRRLDCYALRYSDLADAVATLTALMRA